MASNKNQHFVPRCYLRPFTIDGAGSAINLYNIDRRRFITMAPVKNQCSGDYFYGRDESLESAIQALERAYAASLRFILRPGYQLTDEHRQCLRRFWLFQHLRTEAASRKMVEMNEGVREVVGICDDTFRLQIVEAVQMAMQVFVDSMNAVDDLKVCLLRNRTSVPFITSDDPAVLTNRWYLQDRRARGMSFGLGAAGAILLLPLSPQVLCIGYDGDVYRVPHRGGWVDVRRRRDVEVLNEHQFLGCRANIFVRDPNDGELVHEGFLRASSLRPVQRHRINYAVKDRSESGYERYVVVDPAEAGDHAEALVHTQVVHPVPSGWPDILRWRSRGSVYSNGTGVGYVRSCYAEPHSEPPYIEERARGR